MQQLERDGRALRRLARALVRDASAADDLVQDAWLASLQRGQLGASFLGGAVRRLAQGWRRSAARRAEQERAFVPEPRDLRPDEVVARLELSECVLRTLRGLPEPYRSTLTLHFLDGLSPGEIARRGAIPAGTVRARITRGLAELRQRLAAQLGREGHDWRSALVPLVGMRPAARIAWSTGTVMALKWTLACAISVALAFLGWYAWRGNAEHDALPAIAAQPAGNQAEAAAVDAGSAAAQEDSRRNVQPGVASTAAQVVTRVLARAVDEDGRALAGATLALADGEPGAPSDARGTLLLELPRWIDTGSSAAASVSRLVAHAPGRTELARKVVLHPGEDNWLGEFVLPRAGTLRGRVCDEQGLGLSTARVFATQETVDENSDPWLGPGRSLLLGTVGARCAADGSFCFAALPEGWWIVWATDEGREWSSSERIPVRGTAESASLTLRLKVGDPARALTGCVLDPQGRPCERALVELLDERDRSTWDRQWRTAGDGRFEFRTREPRESLRVRITDADRRYEEIVREARSGDPNLQVQFIAPVPLVLRVLDEAGVAIEGASASALSTSSRFLFPGCHALTDASGAATLRLPSAEYEVDVVAQGFERVAQGPFDPQSGARELEFRLTRGPGLRGRVRAAGREIEGAAITLLECAAPGVRWAPFDEWLRPGGWVEEVQPAPEWRARSDSSGNFTLGVPLGVRARASGRYVVLIEASGWAPALLGPFELDAHSRKDDLLVELQRGGSIDGYCTSALSIEYAGWRVVAANGMGCRREALVDPGGRFQLRNLTPGRWQLAPQPPAAASEWSWHDSSDAPPARTQVEVQGGRAITARCDLLGFEPAVLEGHFDVHADPPGIWTVEIERLRDDGERERASARSLLRLDSTFRLRVGVHGRYRLTLECTDARWGCAQVSDVVELGPRAVRWSGALAFARLQGRVGTQTQLVYAFAAGPGDRRAASWFQPGPAGAIGERWIPSGRVLIADEPHPPGDVIERPLATLEVREDETATLALDR